MKKIFILLLFIFATFNSVKAQNENIHQDTIERTLKLGIELCSSKGFDVCSNGLFPGSRYPKLIYLDSTNISFGYLDSIFFFSFNDLNMSISYWDSTSEYNKVMNQIKRSEDYKYSFNTKKRFKKRILKDYNNQIKRFNNVGLEIKDFDKFYFDGKISYGLMEIRVKYIAQLTEFSILNFESKTKDIYIRNYKCTGLEIVDILDIKPISKEDFFK